MTIKTIKVLAGRTFNHPYENYSNFKHSVVIEGMLGDGEDANTAVKALQAQAEQLAEDHKNSVLTSVRTLREMSDYQRGIASLEETIRSAQTRLEEARQKFSASQTLLPISTDEQSTEDKLF